VTPPIPSDFFEDDPFREVALAPLDGPIRAEFRAFVTVLLSETEKLRARLPPHEEERQHLLALLADLRHCQGLLSAYSEDVDDRKVAPSNEPLGPPCRLAAHVLEVLISWLDEVLHGVPPHPDDLERWQTTPLPPELRAFLVDREYTLEDLGDLPPPSVGSPAARRCASSEALGDRDAPPRPERRRHHPQ